jgi:putative polyhydroxyalkanoate system protein
MSEIVVRRRHGLGLARAKRLAEKIARDLQADYGGSYEWIGNTLSFRRTGASAHVAVTRDSFNVRIEIGLMLAPLRSRIEREVQACCDEHFGRSAAG